MKSLFAKILLWFWFALAITVVGSAFISALMSMRTMTRVRRSRAWCASNGRSHRAYEIGGRPALQFPRYAAPRLRAHGVLTDEEAATC